MNTTELQTRYRRAKIAIVALVAAVIFLILVLVAQMMGGTGNSGATQTAAPNAASSTAAAADGTPEQPRVERRDPEDPRAIGDVDAPVVLSEWTDLRCPFCAVYHRDTLPALIEEYVDTGQVRIEFRDVAYFGEGSVDAAVAARAAARQGHYPEYLATVFAAAPESGHPDMPREKLIGFAEDAGVPDIAQFTADLDDPTLATEVQQETAEAQGLGVTGVPFFLAGDYAFSGAQPADVFREYLDRAIEEAGDN